MVSVHNNLNRHMLIFPQFCPHCSKTSHQNNSTVFLPILPLSRTSLNASTVWQNSFSCSKPFSFRVWSNSRQSTTPTPVPKPKQFKPKPMQRSNLFSDHFRKTRRTFQPPKTCCRLPISPPKQTPKPKHMLGTSILILASLIHHPGKNC